MHDHKHNLLSQLPLTVSPFINLPAAVTLPYTYTIPPSHLPPSSSPYAITSASGQSSVLPADLIEKLSALNSHLESTQREAKEKIKAWEDSIKDRELAEKRRVAPGYLDTGVVMLEPSRVSPSHNNNNKGKAKELPADNSNMGDGGDGGLERRRVESMSAEDALAEKEVQRRGRATSAGEELDRAFGGMGL